MTLRLPPALPDAPRIRVVMPCGDVGPTHRAALLAGRAALAAAVGPGAAIEWAPGREDDAWRGYLAGPDEVRAAELTAALTAPDVDAVWIARGGSGAARIVERVLDAVRRHPPRIVVGFSDATVLLNALTACLGWITFHGPVVTTLGREGAVQVRLDAALDLLRGTRRAVPLPAPHEGPTLEGRLLGGNLTVLASLVGTPTLPLGAVPDPLWLLEDVNEVPYRLDRCFTQLRRAGALKDARGVWLGDLGLTAEEDRVARDALRADVGDLPFAEGAPAGHRGPLALLPLGARVRVATGASTVEVLEPCVEVSRG
jgi:muramoyltetrapeptide carboxypeptidase